MSLDHRINERVDVIVRIWQSRVKYSNRFKRKIKSIYFKQEFICDVRKFNCIVQEANNKEINVINHEKRCNTTSCCYHESQMKLYKKRRRRMSHSNRIRSAPNESMARVTQTIAFITCLLLIAIAPALVTSQQPPQLLQQQQQQQQVSNFNEYHLVGKASGQTQLPCLIGKQKNCGEPYFIAWYKLNVTSKQWTRLDQKTEDELASDQPSGDEMPANSAPASKFTWSRNAAAGGGSSPKSSFSSSTSKLNACLQHPRFAMVSSAPQRNRNAFPQSYHWQQEDQLQQYQYQGANKIIDLPKLAAIRSELESNFDCDLLTINSLDLMDEGQYKCEITFSDSLDDFNKCPTITTSHLLVIARPNEPQLLVNGRLVSSSQRFEGSDGGGAMLDASQPKEGENLGYSNSNSHQLTFKEGAQIKLECQSGGGKPAPRIEWLNVSSLAMFPPMSPLPANSRDSEPFTIATDSNDYNDNDGEPTSGGSSRASNERRQQQQQSQPEVQLMRLHWAHKRMSYVDSSPSSPSSSSYSTTSASGGNRTGQLITSSSVTFSLSRYDLNSRFVCLVIPQTIAQSQQQSTNDMPVRNLAQLGAMINGHVGPQSQGNSQASPLMLKWLKLNVQVKPSSVSLMVRDIETQQRLILQPIQPQQSTAAPSSMPPSTASTSGPQAFYSVQPNRIYAIQCIVEGSRPQAQVLWFNRTAPVKIDQVLLHPNASGDFQVPNISSQQAPSLISSYIRHYEQPNSGGTYRTVASLVISTKIWDHFEEFFCRVTNDAFQFDELTQVAPIISARLYVNYPPFAWLDVETSSSRNPAIKWESNSISSQQQEQQIGRLKVGSGERLTLRCHVAANPLIQNTILQIDWFRDGKKLAAQPPALGPTASAPALSGTQQKASSSSSSGPQIEKTNHLHMPVIDPLVLTFASNNKLLNGASGSNGSGRGIQVARLPANFFPPPASTKLLATSLLNIQAASKLDSANYSCQYKLIPAPPVSALLVQQQNQQQQYQQLQSQIRITSGQANQTIQVQVIEVTKSPILKISASHGGLLVYGQRSSPSDGQWRRLTAVVLDTSALISLYCDTRPSAVGQSAPNGQPDPGTFLDRKVTWYLNGFYLHSSASTNTYNFTLDSLGDQMEKHLGIVTCAHHTLESPTGSPQSSTGGSGGASFHGSQMRVYQSVNELDLKLYVEPKLLDRRDLMPTRRSFSDLELSANPGSKLKLACMAKCEPLCSIDWYLERKFSPSNSAHQPGSNLGLDAAIVVEKPIKLTGDNLRSRKVRFKGNFVAYGSGRVKQPNGVAPAPATTTTMSSDYPNNSNETGKLVQWNYNELSYDDHDDNLQVFKPPLVLLENLVSMRAAQGSRFAWLYESSLSQKQHQSSGYVGGGSDDTSSIEVASRQLMRDAELNLNGVVGGISDGSGGGQIHASPSTIGANVFSKLELTYNQLGQLLAGPSGGGGISSSGGSGSESESGSLFLTATGPTDQQNQHHQAAGKTMTPTLAAAISVAPQSRKQRADEIVIKCKLNTTFRGHLFGRGGGQARSWNYQALGYALVEPHHWFPARDLPEANLVSDGEAMATEMADGFVWSGSGNGKDNDDYDDDSSSDHHHYNYQDGHKHQAEEFGSTNGGAKSSEAGGNQFATMSNELASQLGVVPLNLTSLSHRRQSQQQSLRESSMSGARKLEIHNTNGPTTWQNKDNEMQISIFLDRPPRGVSIAFAGIISSDLETNGVRLTESQLIELMDASKLAAPKLQCQAIGAPYPEVSYKWTFTDLTGTEHQIETEGPPSEINLRRMVEFRQRQLRVNYGVDLITSLVGNYTCSVSNLHGSKVAIMPFQIHGKPMCKLSLGREYLGPENELMANLICSIYSIPQLEETLWFRNSQQIATNKTTADTFLGGQQGATIGLFSSELPVMVLNKQQEFMLTDLMTQTGNFKCIARNSVSYSETCELSPLEKQTLLNTLKPTTGTPVTRTPLSMLSFVEGFGKSPGAIINFLANSSSGGNGNIFEPLNPILVSGQQQQHPQQTPVSLLSNLYAHVDWIVIGACSLILVWLTFIVAKSIFKRSRFGDPRKYHNGGGGGGNGRCSGRSQHETSWRFNTNRRTSSNDDIGVTPITSRPFQSKVCVNYYSGSNGDSEKDMVQSCSQSSHYEEFMQTSANAHQVPQPNHYHQQQQKLISNNGGQMQQPVYFNGNHAATLTRRPMKQSLSSSSTGGSSTVSRQQNQQQVVSQFNTNDSQHLEPAGTNLIQRINTSMYQFDQITTPSLDGSPQGPAPLMNHLGSTLMRDPSRNHLVNQGNKTMTMNNSNVPLINGSHNQSRINLNQHGNYSSTSKVVAPNHNNKYLHLYNNQQNSRFQNNNNMQQTFGGPIRHQQQEHIYDDVIYNNQMLT